MGSSKKVTVGYWYRLIWHHGLCAGPIDAFLEFRGADKVAWQGEVTENETIFVDAENLWGGEKDQGGIQGNLKVLFGHADQEPETPYLPQWFGDQQSAWRGFATVVYIGRYGAMSPYPPDPAYKLRRIVEGWEDDCWYEEKAKIVTTILPISNTDYTVGTLVDSSVLTVAAVNYNLNVCGSGLEDLKIVIGDPTWGGGGNNRLYDQYNFSASGNEIVFQGSVLDELIPSTSVVYMVPCRGVGTYAAWGGPGTSWLIIDDVFFNFQGYPSYIPNSYLVKDGADYFCSRNGVVYKIIPFAYDGLSTPNDRSVIATSATFSGAEAIEVVGSNVIVYTAANIYVLNRNTLSTIATNSGTFPVASASARLFVSDIGRLYLFNHSSGTTSLYRISTDYTSIDLTIALPAWTQVLGSNGPINHWRISNGYLLRASQVFGSAYSIVELIRLSGDNIYEGYRYGMNPAHVLMYMLNQSDTSGVAGSLINTDSFEDGADWFFDNDFGLCAKWYPSQESSDDFILRISQTSGCSISKSVKDGKYYLDVANGVYDLESLPVLSDDDIIRFEEEPTIIDSAVNSVSVTYFDPQRKESITTAPVMAQALIEEYGLRHITLEMPEIPTAALALRVAQRELQQRITPLRAFKLATTPIVYPWRPNTYFRLQIPKRGIADMVCILGEKLNGTFKSGAITISAIQDVFSLPTIAFAGVEEGVDIEPGDPEPIVHQAVFEAPYIDVVAILPRAELEALPEDVGYLEAVAVDPAISFNYAMYVDTGGGYLESTAGDWTPSLTIVEDDEDWVETDFTFENESLLELVEIGTAALWGNEICRLDAIDLDAKTISLARGCADTIPQQHAAGSRIYFWQAGAAGDTTEYLDAQTIDVKLLPTVGTQQLDIADATPMELTFDQRWFRPYPPADVQINGESWPVAIDGEAEFTWVFRDRVLQENLLVDWYEATVGLEPDASITVELYDETDTLQRIETGITATSYAWADEISDSGLGRYNSQIRAVIKSERDVGSSSIESLYSFDYTVERAGYGFHYGVYLGGT